MTILTCDGSNLIHRSFYVANNSNYNKTKEDVLKATTKLCLQTLFSNIWEFEANYVYVLLDRTRPSDLTHSMKKVDESREYDESRSNIISETMSILTRLLNNCNVPCLHYPGIEADDIGYVLSKEHTNSGRTDLMWLFTGDMDWYQGISDNVSHWDFIRHRETNKDKMIQDYGDNYRLAYIAYESLVRNKDGVCGVDGIGDASATSIMNCIIDPESNYLKIPDIDNLPIMPVYREAFRNGIPNFIKNWETIDYEWIYRSGLHKDVSEFLEVSRSNATHNQQVIDEVLDQIGRDKMNRCLSIMKEYIQRSHP